MRFLACTFGALAAFGVQTWLWGKSEARLGGPWTIVFQGMGSAAVAASVFLLLADRALIGTLPRAGVLIAVVAGMLGATGALCFVWALGLDREQYVIVVSLSAAYPVVAVLLRSFELRSFTWPAHQWIGMILVVVGCALLLWRE